VILTVGYLAIDLLGLSNGQDAVSNCFPVRIIKKVASLPWDDLRIPIVSFQIVTQYINITGIYILESLRYTTSSFLTSCSASYETVASVLNLYYYDAIVYIY
jgi:hypothetical protein